MQKQQFGELGDVPIPALARILDAVATSLTAEGVSDTVVARVRNRLIWGNPDGANAVIRLDPDDLNRVLNVDPFRAVPHDDHCT